MALVPIYDADGSDTSYLDLEFEETTYPSKTYRINGENESIGGNVDGIEAVKQAIFCALRCERYDYPIYSDNYGVELTDLIGEPMDYVIAEVERRITECLTWDSRIESVEDFEFEEDGRKLTVTFTVNTIYGTIEDEEMEVEF